MYKIVTYSHATLQSIFRLLDMMTEYGNSTEAINLKYTTTSLYMTPYFLWFSRVLSFTNRKLPIGAPWGDH